MALVNDTASVIPVQNGVFVAVGIVALVWVATIPLPAVVARIATVVAAASLALFHCY